LASVRPAVYTYTAPNTVDGVAYLYAQARGVILKSQLVNDAAADLVMAVDEALSNAHRHGQVNEGPVELKVIWLQERLVVTVRDSGNGFDPALLSDPCVSENVLKENGRGLFLMRAMADSVEFDYSSGEFTVTLVKHGKQQKNGRREWSL
jgi:serine/threonine-protein kinase RsbW